MQKKVIILSAALIVAVLQVPAYSSIVTFDFNSGNGNYSSKDPNVANNPVYTGGSGLVAVFFTLGGVTGQSASARPFPDPDAASALANDRYWYFTVTAAANYHLNLTDLSFDEKHFENVEGVHGPISFQVSTSTNPADLLSPEGASTLAWANYSVDLSAAAFDNLSTITFYIPAWDGSIGNFGKYRQWFNDNVVLNGTVEQNVVIVPNIPVPEPGSLIVWSLVAGFFGARTIRRRRK